MFGNRPRTMNVQVREMRRKSQTAPKDLSYHFTAPSNWKRARTDPRIRTPASTIIQARGQAMDISSTSGLSSYAYTPSSNKSDTSANLAMLNEADKMQAESAGQRLQSVTETTASAPTLPDHLGRTINVTA